MDKEKQIKYFIDIAGDWFTCTSDVTKNKDGMYVFNWSSDFQSGTIEYDTLEGNVVEITRAEYDLIRMTVENEELIDLQNYIKEMVVGRKEKNRTRE